MEIRRKRGRAELAGHNPEWKELAREGGIEPLNKGWSSDRKFIVETPDEQKFLLRVSGFSEYEQKRAGYEMLKRMADLGVPAPLSVDFSVSSDGKSVYIRGRSLTALSGVPQ